MKIIRMKWENYKGLPDGEIHADGCDVYVCGRNGTGKSSIASIIPFVLFGKKDEVRKYEDGFAMNAGLIHSAEIEFDNGLILRRERHDSLSDNSLSGKCYINGELRKDKDFDAEVARLMNKAGEMILNPFAFCEMKKTDQRTLLLKHFGTLNESALLQLPEYETLAKELKGVAVQSFKIKRQDELKKFKSEAKEIPAKIAELRLQLKDKPANIEALIARLNNDMSERQAKIAEYRKLMRNGARVEYDRIVNRIDSLARTIEQVERDINSDDSRLNELRKEYITVRSQEPGKCPTCGQTVPTEKFKKWQDGRLSEINDAGQKLRRSMNEMADRLAEMKIEQSKLQEQLTALKPQVERENNDELFTEVQKLNDEIGDIRVEISRLNEYRGTENRIAELSKREKELNAEITRSEGLIAAAEDFQRRAVSEIEGEINAQFEHVTFKLFNLLTTGELSPTCEATLHGVPYSSLSKGERLKAAMDIWRTWQRVFKTELPLILDDAESYTPNSFVDVPNQKFYFLVTESDLTISVLRERQAA